MGGRCRHEKFPFDKLRTGFDTIPHTQLMAEVEKFISDDKVQKLVQTYLEQDILDGINRWTPIAGAPQGAVIGKQTEKQVNYKIYR